MPVKFNCEVTRAEDGEEQHYGWQTRAQVKRLIDNMEDGDDVVIHAVDAPEGTL